MTKRWLGWVALPLWLVVSVADAGELPVAKPDAVPLGTSRLSRHSRPRRARRLVLSFRGGGNRLNIDPNMRTS